MRPTGICRILLLAGAAVTALTGAALAADAAKRGGTLIFARPDEPLTFDPFVPNDNGSIYALEQVCDSLIEPDDTGLGLVPGLAESWEIAPDGLVYTFTLRDAKFSNGEPVTADDVVFSLQTLAKPERPMSFLLKPVKSVEKVDDKHVKLTLSQPYAPILSSLSAYAAAIVSKKAYEADAEKFGSQPVCAGPFQVAEYARGSKVTLTRNPNFWEKAPDGQPLPYLDTVEMNYVPESNARVLGLRNGDYDVISTVAFNQAAQLQGGDEVTLESQPIFRLDYVYLNHAKKPLDNEKLRLALNYAANREAILKAVYFGFGELPNSYMPKVNFHSDAVKPIPYDIEKAKALVQESGYDGTPIQIMVDTGNAPFRQIATILQQGWKEAGIESEIVEFDVGTSWTNTTKGEYMAYVSYITSDINDTDELATLEADFGGGTNAFFTWYNNPEVTDLLNQARSTLDNAKRAELYAKVQDIVYNAGYSVPLNFVPAVNAHHNYVKGWRQLANGWWWLKYVSLDK